jgi:hypothetical protein
MIRERCAFVQRADSSFSRLFQIPNSYPRDGEALQ